MISLVSFRFWLTYVSDPAASTLALLLILLAERPDLQKKLREEMDKAVENNAYGCGKQIPFLDGVINECLRLYPSVIFQSQRLTPPEGLSIGSVYIPGDTIICLGPYQQGRGKISGISFLRLQLI